MRGAYGVGDNGRVPNASTKVSANWVNVVELMLIT